MNCWKCGVSCGYPVCNKCSREGWKVNSQRQLINWKTGEIGTRQIVTKNKQLKI